jgi:hypothetical protein
MSQPGAGGCDHDRPNLIATLDELRADGLIRREIVRTIAAGAYFR